MRKYLIVLFILCNSANAQSGYGMTDFAINHATCEYIKQNDIGICLKNKTGELITGDQLKFGMSFEYKGSSGSTSFGSSYSYELFYPNTYMILQTSRARLQKGDLINKQGPITAEFNISLPYDPNRYSNEISSCRAALHYNMPPYKQPVVMILEKINNQYECHYE